MSIRNWLNQHCKAATLSFQRLKQQPLNTLFAAIVIGVVLALPASGEMLLSNFMQFSKGISVVPELSVFMKLDASEQEIRRLNQHLSTHPNVQEFRHIAQTEALAKMKQQEGLGKILDDLPNNPFPDSFVITPRYPTPNELEHLREELAGAPGVEQVQLDSAWAKRLNAALHLGRSAVLGLGVFLGIGLIAITFNTIRLQILTHRAEIEVIQLLGASKAFVRRPFLYFGALQGLLGGGIAWIIVTGVATLLREPITELTELYGVSFQLHALPQTESLILLALSGAFGWMGAMLSVERQLNF